MEVKNLYPFIILLVTVGMIIGIGIITLDKFGAATYYTREDYNDSVTVLNFTAQDLDYGNITVSAVWNGTTNALPGDCYSINRTDGHFIYTNQTIACDVIGTASFYAIYDFKEYATETRDAAMAVNTEIAKIATDWLGLIVTVFVLAIILWLVIRSFGGVAERQ